MAVSSQTDPDRATSVFINCPFDADYRELFRAIVFTVVACGFFPRCALDFNDGAEVRFVKIVRLLANCDHAIHDLSRVELDSDSGLPRFNMPLELGAHLGLRIAGPSRQRRKRALILDSHPHRYDQFLSDISGQDIAAHGGTIDGVIGCVRDWLNGERRGTPLPGAEAFRADYAAFRAHADAFIAEARLDPWEQLSHRDYLWLVHEALGVAP